jgi:DNA replication and repair protein RecF
VAGTLKLRDFRNYHYALIELEPGINVVIGDNGRGKTNLLEALFFLLQGKTMRTNDISELIKRGEEEAVVEGVFNIGGEIKSRVVIKRGEGVQVKRRIEEVQAVFFQPDDIWMVKGGPEARRKYIDEATLEIKRGYKDILREYQRVLKQRNEAIRAVRKGVKNRGYMRNWNPLLCKHGSQVVFERAQTIKSLEAEMERLGNKWGKEKVELKYYTSMGDSVGDEKKTLEKIERMEEAEIRRGISLIGPHRDELLFLLGGRNARRECSQGEQKLLAVMWSMAQARMMEEKTDKKLLLLMDDCLSELDEENRSLLMREFGEWEQVVVTATDDMPEFKGHHKVFLAEQVET